jgi:hypothetical protein
MRKQRLHFDNLDEVLRSSKSARSKGAQQFETPREVAEALCLPLPSVRPIIVDLQCGHGGLLHAAAVTGPRRDTRHLLGIDIDPTASIPEYGSRFGANRSIIHGDFTKLAPMLLQVKARFDLLVLNPPFSLRWDMRKLPPPAECEVDSGPISSAHVRTTTDSTLATFEMAHRLLTKRGEGMMICNAATCARLLEKHPLWKRTWLRLTLPNFFPDTLTKMKIAVLYFAAGHVGETPLELIAPDAIPATIVRTLEWAAKRRPKLIRNFESNTVCRESDAHASTHAFEAVEEEWQRLTDKRFAETSGYNVKLSTHGTISCCLTPFQTITGSVPLPVVDALKKIDGQHPAGLVVQRVSRKALILATNGGIWRVHPEVTEAVTEALKNYNATRAPLRPLNPVQRLGYLDEEDEIRCERPPCSGFTAGLNYPLESEIFEGCKIEKRRRLHHSGNDREHEYEDVLVTGQELLLRVKDERGEWHAFTQYDLGHDQKAERPEQYFHRLSELVECFRIPEVPDVAQCHPKLFAEYQKRLLELEWE